MMFSNFHLSGRVFDIMINPPYYDDGLTYEDLENLVSNEIIKILVLQKQQRVLNVRQGRKNNIKNKRN